MIDPAHPNNMVGTIFLIALVAFVLAMRLRRMRQGRRLRLGRLWVVPAFYALLAAWLISISAPSPRIQIACVGALAIGCVLGWQRARLVELSIDAESHRLTQRESPWVIMFVILVIAIRFGARAFGDRQDGPWHLGVVAATDILLSLVFGLLAMQRFVLWRRGKAMLAAARAG